MANLIITYWRDIPSAVSVKAGRREEKRMLADRFQEAIDMAAMRGDATDTD
ncbi:MAG: virulence factor, partial [Aestuariivirga sp.]